MDATEECARPWREFAGYGEAVRRYGEPVERWYDYGVGPQAFEERQLALSKREAEVVLALRRPSGRYLLHTKWFYPQGTYRLLSGGIKRGEALLTAVARELREETSLSGRVERFLAVQRHVFRLQDQVVPFTSFIVLVAGDEGVVSPLDAGEGITEFREVPLDELAVAACQLEALPSDWVDWGRFRATAHRLVVELLMGQGGECQQG